MSVVVLDVESCGRVDATDEIAGALRLGMSVAVVDLVFDRELRGRGGERLACRGLRIECLADIGPALGLRTRHPCLSLGDAFSLSLAAANRWTLLTSSSIVASVARELGVSVTAFERAPARVSYPRSPYGLVACFRR